VECELAGETEVLGEKLPQCHFLHHKSHMTWPGSNTGRRSGKPATNRLRYDTALMHSYKNDILNSIILPSIRKTYTSFAREVVDFLRTIAAYYSS
jgi:hypothetical protein